MTCNAHPVDRSLPRAGPRGAWLLAIAVGALCLLGGSPALARAARVVVLADDGHATVRSDPFLPPAVLPPAAGVRESTRSASRRRAPAGPTVRGELARLYHSHQISQAAYRTYLGEFNSALKEVKRLSSARGGELEAVIEILHQMAVGGTLTASRLSVLFLTLERNAQYWQSGPLLGYGQRVEFAGSDIVWEYYPGQGIQLQQLGSFGKASYLCGAGPHYAAQCRTMLSELIPLAVHRAGGLVWEYYFNFDGGAPPWTSAMSQGTAVEALTHAYAELHDSSYLTIAHEALPVFSTPPPAGVGVRTKHGMRYVQYTFDSGAGDEVINAFAQTLIGLDEYAGASRDPVAQRLFAEGDAEAQAELPRFNTGAWSLYQPGLEDDLSYHQLVTGFLQQLCSLTKTPVYCHTAAAFTRDLKTPPQLQLLTRHLVKDEAAAVYFDLSKVSHVGIIVRRGSQTVFLTSADFPYGEHAFKIPALTRKGTYTITLAGTDLAGNFSRVTSTVQVSG